MTYSITIAYKENLFYNRDSTCKYATDQVTVFMDLLQ